MSFEDSYGELANRLVLQAKLSLQLGKLLPYSGPLVRLVIQEQHELEKKIQAMKYDGVTTSEHARWPTLIILARCDGVMTTAHEHAHRPCQSGCSKQTMPSGIPLPASRHYSGRLLGSRR